MDLRELIDAFRTRADDKARPYLWSDDEITLFLNEAQAEAADRARLIHDETTDAVCSVAISSGTAAYDLNDSILEIRRAILLGESRPLTVTSREELDMEWPGWESATGTPRCCFETGDGKLTLVPSPTDDGTVRLSVHRLPLAALEADADEPEIHRRHHYRLLDWALRCAYLKNDADTHDDQKAASYEAMFERSFGARPDANVQRKHRDKRPPIVKVNW